MLITSANKFVQKHGRAAFIIIGIIIVIPFVFMYGGASGCRGQGAGAANSVVGEAFGETVRINDLKDVQLSLQLRFGGFVDRMNLESSDLLTVALRRKRMLAEADKRGLTEVSDQEIIDAVTELPPFQDEDGEFNEESFKNFAEMLRRDSGSAKTIDRIVRENIIIKRLEDDVKSGVVVSNKEAVEDLLERKEKFVVEHATFSYGSYLKEVSIDPSEEEIEAYHLEHYKEQELTPELTEKIKTEIVAPKLQEFWNENVEIYREQLEGGKTPEDLKRMYAEDVRSDESLEDEEKYETMSEYNETVKTYLEPYYEKEKRKISVVEFKFSDYEISEESIAAYYEENKEDYRDEKVSLSQIVITIPADADDAVKAEKRKALEDIRKQLFEGADFAELARTHSEDEKSKSSGGQLLMVAANTLDKAVKTAFDAMEDNAVSEIIEGESAFYLIRRKGAQEFKPFSTVKTEIKRSLQSGRAEISATEFADKVFSKSRENPEQSELSVFKKMAAEAEKETIDSGWFGENGSNVPNVGYHKKLAQEGFKLSDDYPISNAIEGNNQWFVACHIADREAYLPAFNREQAFIRKLKSNRNRVKAKELAVEKAEAAMKELDKEWESTEAFEKAAETFNFRKSEAFSQEESADKQDLPNSSQIQRELVGSDLEAGSFLEPIKVSNGTMLVYLVSREKPTEEILEKEDVESAKTRLQSSKEREVLQDFYKQLKEESNTILEEGWSEKDFLMLDYYGSWY